MSQDKATVHALSIALVLALLCAFFVPSSYAKAIAALILIAFAVAVPVTIKKRSILSHNKTEVFLIMLAVGAVCLVVYYLSGIYFGFYRSSTPFSISSLFKNILPIAAIIIAIEIIRYVLLAQKWRVAHVCAYIGGVMSEVLIFASLEGIHSFSSFMDAVGLYLLPAITANVLFCMLSSKYGFLPIMVYRLIFALYGYVLPVYPQTPDILVSFAKMVVPLLAFWFISALYTKGKAYETTKVKTAKRVSVGAAALIMIAIVMLISARFQYRAIIIATESMTGALNKGDLIVYEAYDDQYLSEQDVVVYQKSDARIVHRIVMIERVDGANRYYTKGDANQEPDDGFITDASIEGVVLFRVPYVGYASIWLREFIRELT